MKLGITGKGRCNLTNNCDNDTFIKNMTKNGKFMFSAINTFSTADTISFFENLGVPLKTERGNRVFPVSDKAHDIVMALKNYALENGAKIIHENVVSLIPTNSDERKIAKVKTEKSAYVFDEVILCTGGKSYPTTGSDGFGYEIAKALGHTVIQPIPSLIGLTSQDTCCKDMQGLTLKNVGIEFEDTKKRKSIYKDFGELLFTHFGVSGPTVLSASAHLRPMESGRYILHIDLKPALDREKLDRRLLSDFEKYKNKEMANALCDLLPSSMILTLLSRAKISENKKVNSVTHEERNALLSVLKDFSVEISGTRPIEEAIVTSGGISVS